MVMSAWPDPGGPELLLPFPVPGPSLLDISKVYFAWGGGEGILDDN